MTYKFLDLDGLKHFYNTYIAKKIDTNGDISNTKATFTQASTRTNIATGETLKVILGKIKKYFADLKTVAFSGSYSDLTGKPTVVNNLTTTTTNTVLDGRQGKALNDKITSINSALTVETRTVTGIFVDLQIVRSANTVWIRISSNAKKPMSRNQDYELFKLSTDLPVHSLYRRIQIDDNHGFFFKMGTDGQITLTPYSTDISQGEGINVSEIYLSN